jgi:hypothetical protein
MRQRLGAVRQLGPESTYKTLGCPCGGRAGSDSTIDREGDLAVSCFRPLEGGGDVERVREGTIREAAAAAAAAAADAASVVTAKFNAAGGGGADSTIGGLTGEAAVRPRPRRTAPAAAMFTPVASVLAESAGETYVALAAGATLIARGRRAMGARVGDAGVRPRPRRRAEPRSSTPSPLC